MTRVQLLPTPPPSIEEVATWVADHLGDLAAEESSDAAAPMRGGQQAADAALQAYDVAGYARRRNNVWPPDTRGSSSILAICAAAALAPSA